MEIKKGNFTLHSDKNNVWVTETVISDDTGKAYEKNYGYYRHVKDCLRAFASKKVLGPDAADITAVLAELDRAFDVVNVNSLFPADGAAYGNAPGAQGNREEGQAGFL